jgi:hypothetical protein
VFIRYNPGPQRWEYDTSPNQTGVGPWLLLPIHATQIVDLPPVPPLPGNIAYVDAANIFTPAQTFKAKVELDGFIMWVNPSVGVDLKKWHNFVQSDGGLVLYPINDAESAVLNPGFAFTRNGTFLTQLLNVQSAVNDIAYFTGNGFTRIHIKDLSQPAGTQTFHIINYNQRLYLAHSTDDATGWNPSVNVNIDRNGGLTANALSSLGYVYSNGLVFPNTQISNSGANVLDDYEEGTWLPRIWGGDGEVTSYSTQVGSYTKVGNLVTVGFDAVMQAANWSGGNPVYILLPFNPIGASGGCAMGYWGAVGSFIWITASLEPGNARCHFPVKNSTVSGGIDTYLLTGQTGPGTRFSGTLTFSVAT